jgi:hypothetical protein
MGSKNFNLTQEHIILVSKMYVSEDWDYDLIRSNRPFGDDDYIPQMLEILNIAPSYIDDTESKPRKLWKKELRQKMETIFKELPTALQIILQNFSSGNVQPGTYTRENYGSWKLL